MGYRLSKIYTRTGDQGTTSLNGKVRLPKNALQIEVVGTLDELNCAIGLVLANPQLNSDIESSLTQFQHDLFDIGGELCLPQHVLMTEEKVRYLETLIDKWNEDLMPLKEFILPRGACHFARAVCRRAERCLVALDQQQKINPEILRYVNRLSDALFVAARILDKNSPEIMWDHV